MRLVVMLDGERERERARAAAQRKDCEKCMAVMHVATQRRQGRGEDQSTAALTLFCLLFFWMGKMYTMRLTDVQDVQACPVARRPPLAHGRPTVR